MKLAARLLAVLSLSFASLSVTQAQSLSTTELQIGLYKIKAEVAENSAARQLGLMHRNFLPTDEGLLFVFEYPAMHCFWMRNTKIPLSIAFIGHDGRIVNIEEMKAMTEDNHCPSKPVRFALEMNQAWFAKRGITAGHIVSGLPGR